VEMARLDTTHIDVHPQISDVQETIRECVASMESEIDDRLLEIGCDKQPPDIAFDRRLMKLAIKQIIDNALKYSPADKPVAVRVLASNGILTIEITDHGPGVPVEEQTRIFHRFYRSPSVKDQIPGSGLGLTIARSIAQAHKGDLTVTSRPGETTFRITLPTSYATIAALKMAGALASGLSAHITLVVAQAVPYPLPLEDPPVLLDFIRPRLGQIASDSPVETTIRHYLCRDRLVTLTAVLKRGSIVVIGGRKKWWPTREKILVSRLRRFGHDAILTETT